ncbi:MAG TPA: tRNA uridine-5-carboxymethylaminomethyl(34) synthesis GTPase MnmE [Bacteroidales bacterium]|nr:MAG: tRNA uridine-5-carboxymethylaminomethyl(34) synthesis GTPase MnmE [Bacteroidetes bacterium GWE2_42_24]OFY28942.1 MAG: tRNA uridine-5-carboxymethylaminomethyl(34) synthesis GTPase MnmE [Bacteroidetes bacterium GWF2_43_11]PKP27979.1 MAG: tRNA uridine-5-carboxymethylaminomethyl(34) synthesis GTPase MnmE [Bacteroidetes bacterium HGW-Bacteroidetes-22]HBZ65595.1 tRNA uridine-5-carboxymethylaminomethyl(34) synthesis GTPase MnmE [Bacteroidales bacterium]
MKTHSAISGTTIAAPATASGEGAISLIRVSGPKAVELVDNLFKAANRNTTLRDAAPYSVHYGRIEHPTTGILDEVLVTVFRSPRSYTGEDMVEISCHGSSYIRQKLLELITGEGAQLAAPGEFTLRAFLNGKMDLSQAEAVADLIASESEASHHIAMNQLRGGFSSKIAALREKLVNFASLIELELDFSEEDVEFADRTAFRQLLSDMRSEVQKLIDSFKLGNAVRKGIPVTIAGKPNVGKSTLLNALLNDERAIVSETPGTTRDTIEDTMVINGYNFRFIDTAGIRHTNDEIESMGIERTLKAIEQSLVVIYLFDMTTITPQDIENELRFFSTIGGHEDRTYILAANKTDLLGEAPSQLVTLLEMDMIFISAKRHENLNLITNRLLSVVSQLKIDDSPAVCNVRHLDALQRTLTAIDAIETGLQGNLPADLLSVDVRQALHYLGEITGTITNDELLGNIFSKFCIGK